MHGYHKHFVTDSSPVIFTRKEEGSRRHDGKGENRAPSSFRAKMTGDGSDFVTFPWRGTVRLKELRHDILSHYLTAKSTVKALRNLKIMVC